MRAQTRSFLAHLPARKRSTLVVLLVLMFGGALACNNGAAAGAGETSGRALTVLATS